MMHGELQLPSPLQYLDTWQGVEIWVKRDDQIHPVVSGNKGRKLRYFAEQAYQTGATELLTFGGAYSNHLAATAYLGRALGLPTAALVRGHEVRHNPTLDYCRQQGMRLLPLKRSDYALKDDPVFREGLREWAPGALVIPEGGKGALGVKGVRELYQELENPHYFTDVAVAAGTGTTAAGLLMAPWEIPLWVFPALKGGLFLQKAIATWAYAYEEEVAGPQKAGQKLRHGLGLVTDYHVGGYAKVNDALIAFMNEFYQQYQLPLDPVYTGKLFYGLKDLLDTGRWQGGHRLLVIHTGGLQGIQGMNQQRARKGQSLIEYEA